jgi:flavodoxin short chain
MSNAVRIGIIFWSGMGNTERMASLIRQGAEASGASVTLKNVADASADELSGYDAVALGSPAICAEIEESEMSPFVKAATPALAGRRAALFGSYGWGDDEWLRKWADEMRAAGVNLILDGLAVRESPEGSDADACVEWGATLARATRPGRQFISSVL